MEWWSATLGLAGLAAGAILTRSAMLSLVTLALFMPLALQTLYFDFSRFWILMLLSFAVELAALAGYVVRPAPHEAYSYRPREECERAAEARA